MLVAIAEKGSQAKQIAASLNLTARNGVYHGLFKGQPIVLWYAAGHLVEPKSPGKAIPNFKWEDPKTHESIPRHIDLVPCNDIPASNGRPAREPAKKLEQLKEYVDKATLVIGATDPDREGEVIYRSILDYLGYQGPMMRVWLSKGLTPKAISAAFSNMVDASEYEGSYLAGMGRRYGDYGSMVLTSTYTYYGRLGLFGTYLGVGNGKESTVSVGRVQSTTLGFIGDRHLERLAFSPVTQYKPYISFVHDGYLLQASYSPTYSESDLGKPFDGVIWEDNNNSLEMSADLNEEELEALMDSAKMKPKFVSLGYAEAFKNRLLNAEYQVSIGDTKSMTTSPPNPLSLTGLQSRITSASAKDVAQAAQKLYEQGYINYSRTEDTKLSKDLYDSHQLNHLFSELAKWDEFSQSALQALQIHCSNEPSKAPNCYSAEDITHDALSPVAPPSPSTLTGLEREVFVQITQSFIQAHLPASVYHVTPIEITVEATGMLNEPKSAFTLTQKKCVSPGWEAAFKRKSSSQDNSEQQDTNLIHGNGRIQDVEIKESTSKKPPLFTEASLLAMMFHCGRLEPDEELRRVLKASKGIGTPATRPAIILTLLVRGYIEYVGKTTIDITPKGLELLKVVPVSFRKPGTTALWEQKLRDIESCKTEDKANMYSDFVDKQLGGIEKLIRYLNKNLLSKVPAGGVNPNLPLSRNTREMIVKRSKGLGLPFPAHVLSTEVAGRDWLNKNPWVITEAMKRKLVQIKTLLNVQLPNFAATDFKLALDIIKEHEKNLPPSKPSAKHIQYAQTLANKAGISIPSDILVDSKKLSRFIDSVKTIKPATRQQIDTIKKLWIDLKISEEIPAVKTSQQADALLKKIKTLQNRGRG